jgi:hypothetical protein
MKNNATVRIRDHKKALRVRCCSDLNIDPIQNDKLESSDNSGVTSVGVATRRPGPTGRSTNICRYPLRRFIDTRSKLCTALAQMTSGAIHLQAPCAVQVCLERSKFALLNPRAYICAKIQFYTTQPFALKARQRFTTCWGTHPYSS